MFTCGPDAHEFSPAALAGLRVCLNAPVLNTSELPVGPAKAAIVLFVEDYGNLCLGIGVRSVDSGQLAFFTYRGTIDESQTPERIMAPALTLAEGMGFLFDEDMMSEGTERARAVAYEAWMDLVGELEETLSEEIVLDELPLDDELDLGSGDSLELMLEEQLEDDLGDGFDDDGFDDAMLAEAAESLEPEPQAPAPQKARARVRPGRGPAAAPADAAALSKFRNAPARPAAKPQAGGAQASAPARQLRKKEGGGAALGRVPIVKVRRGGVQGAEEAPSFLARVLGGF